MPLVLLVATTRAEDTPKADAPVMDMEARKASVVTLRRHVAQREERLGEISGEILSLDKRLETKIDGIVKMLSELKDSNDSKTKVARTKQDAIASLKRTIDAYVAKRADIREEMKTTTSSSDRDALAADAKRFDSRISKRIDQIAEITKSMTQHEDVKKYESTGGGGYWNGVYYDDTRISEEWKQNRRDARLSDSQRKDLTDALRDSIEDLKQQESGLKTKLADKPAEAKATVYKMQLEEVRSLIDQRQKQLVDVAKPSEQASTKAIGQEEAYQLDNLLEDARHDLADDFNTILRRYSDLVKERSHVKELEDNLKAREAWLAEKGVTVPADAK
ncbi:MAG: hypothetical protein QM755_05960 [Luteolibacter sp.]